MQHSHIVLHFFLPADQQTPEPVDPAVGSFHYPASRPVTWNGCLFYPFFSPAPNVGCVTPGCHQRSHLGIVVPFVQAHILGQARGWLRALNYGGFQRTLQQLHVMSVSSIHYNRDGHPMALRQQASFGPRFATIGRIRACSFSPPRVPWSWPHPSLDTPSLGRGRHHIRSIPPAIAAGTPRQPAIPGIDHAPCWPLPSTAAKPSTGSPCAGYRKSRPYIPGPIRGAFLPLALGHPLATAAQCVAIRLLGHASCRLPRCFFPRTSSSSTPI